MIYYRMRTNKVRSNHNVTTALTIVVLLALFCFSFIHAVDRSIDNQDRMLCNSAKISSNEQYLNKCACYYSTNNIECIQK